MADTSFPGNPDMCSPDSSCLPAKIGEVTSRTLSDFCLSAGVEADNNCGDTSALGSPKRGLEDLKKSPRQLARIKVCNA
jgi:hypothetical protein